MVLTGLRKQTKGEFMNREQLFKIRDLLSTGDIIAKEENEYRITDKAVIKLINEIERLKANPVEKLVSQPSEPIFGQWIDVKDKLPEINEPVLIYDGSGIAVARMAEPPYNNWWVNDTYGFADDGLIPQVYKWMPLPKP